MIAAAPDDYQFRGKAAFAAYRPPRGHWWRMILGILRAMRCVKDGVTTIIEEETEVATTKVRIRRRDGLALTTLVLNSGAATLEVYEADNLILLVPAGKQRQLPGGRLELKGRSTSGTLDVTVTTTRRSLCGVPDDLANASATGTPLL